MNLRVNPEQLKTSISIIFRIVCAGVAIFYTTQCVIKYLEKEIGTRVNYVPTSQAEFPDITVCWRLGYKKNILKEYGFLDHRQVLDSGNFPAKLSVYEFMNRTRFSVTEFVLKVKIKTFSKVRGSYEHVLYDQDHPYGLEWSPVADRDHGLCYSTRIPNDFIQAGVATAQFGFYSQDKFGMETGTDFNSRGWIVKFHQHGQFRKANTITVGVITSYTTEIAISHGVFIKKKSPKNDCSLDMNYGYDICWESTVNKILWTREKCLFPWNIGNLTQEDEDRLCQAPEHYKGTGEETAWAELRDTELKNCELPCQFMTFSSSPAIQERWKLPSGATITDQAMLNILFNEDIKVTLEFLVYDVLSMVGEAGGYLGLFLGISCYEMIVKLCYWLLERNFEERACSTKVKPRGRVSVIAFQSKLKPQI